MCSERETVEAFLAHSFGVCVVADGALAGWCLSEYNCGLRCEVGIETAEPYRRRGLATAMTLALVEQARTRGYTHVGWHCRSNNAPSAATAVRSGLRKVCDYPAFIAFFDPIDNLAVNGNYAWQAGRLDEALQWYARAFALGEAKNWAYWYAAGAAAVADNCDLAIAYLTNALAKGYRVSADQLSQNAWFVGLHDMPAWQQLLASAA
jgi:tetratricopeptide (TPR) repeat protein